MAQVGDIVAKKKKGGKMSGMRKTFKKAASAIGSIGAIAIPAVSVGWTVKTDLDKGMDPAALPLDYTLGWNTSRPAGAEWKWERLLPLWGGIVGGIAWKKAWSILAKYV